MILIYHINPPPCVYIVWLRLHVVGMSGKSCVFCLWPNGVSLLLSLTHYLRFGFVCGFYDPECDLV